MNTKLSQYIDKLGARLLMSFAIGVAVFLFWLICYPQLLSYHEQYQLFLLTTDYFVDEMRVAGGLAQYIGEFIVQFYIYESLGALLISVVSAVMTYLISKFVDKGQILLAVIPTALLLWHMGDENTMMAFPIAIIIALLSYMTMKKVHWLADIAVYPVMFWLIGPMVWLYAGLRVKDWKSACGLIYLISIQLLCAKFILVQWPMENVMLGIWYYRYEDIMPALQIIIPIVIVVIVKASRFLTFDKKYILQAIAVCVLAVLAVTQGFDKDKYELIKQDYLIRNERWSEVVQNAEKYTVRTEFWSECVNLSLAMTGQLSTRMFDFFQSDEQALIMPMYRDMTSNLPSMEAFYRLGMTNECLRYAYDLQESIPQGKKSGRLSKRIVECCLVSGRHDVAKKYLGLLKKSMFYRVWAENTEAYVGNESMINSNPKYRKMRENAFKTDFLFYYPELAKVFYHLFLSNTDNKMALEYMLGQTLLDGNINVFMQLVGAVNQYGGYAAMPYTYQDAIQYIQSQGQMPGSKFGAFAERMSHRGESVNVESASAH